MDQEKVEKVYDTLNVEDTYHIKDNQIDYNFQNKDQFTIIINIKSKFINGIRDCQSNFNDLNTSIEFIEALYEIARIKQLKLRIDENKYYISYKNKIRNQEVSLDFLSSDHDIRFAPYMPIADIMDRNNLEYDLKLCSYVKEQYDKNTMLLYNGYFLHVSKEGNHDYIFQKLDSSNYMINIDPEHDMDTDLLVIKERLPMINTINDIAGQTYISSVDIDLSYENPLITIHNLSSTTQIYASKLLEEYKVDPKLIKFMGSAYYNGHNSQIYKRLLSIKDKIHDNILNYNNYLVEFKNDVYHISYNFSDKIKVLINEHNINSLFSDIQNIDKYLDEKSKELKRVNKNVKGNLIILIGFRNRYVLNGHEIKQSAYDQLTKFTLFSR